MIAVKDIAWAAGFIEGEGSFGHVSTACVRAAQVQREPLERLQKMFGGNIRLQKRNRTNPRNANSADIWNWYIYGRRAASVIMTILPLLSARRFEQAVAALNTWKRGIGSAKLRSMQTHCKNGHEFSVENTKITKSGHRQCRECHRADSKRRYMERKKHEYQTL